MTRSRAIVVAAPALAFLAVFLVWPLLAIGERSLQGGIPWDVLSSRSTFDLVWFSMWLAAASTLLTLLAALPLTWAVARHTFRGRSLVEALALVPFVLPTLVVATGFVALLPGDVERTLWAILLAHVFFNVAVVLRIVAPVWGALDPRLDDAARSLGAGAVARARTVTLPLLRPALLAAGAVVFLFSFTSFGIVLILGAPRYATLEVEIYNQAVRLFDLRTATTLALLQLAAVAVVVGVAQLLESRLDGVGGRGPRRPAPTGRLALLVYAIATGTVALLALPPLAVVARAFGREDGLRSFGALTRETPALLVPPWHAVVNSLVYATGATLLALAVGLPAAVAAARGARVVGIALMLPLGASAAILGFGFLLAFDSPPLDLRSSRLIVPLAQALVALPFVLRALVPALRGLDPRLGEVAATLGATPATIRRTIDLPLLSRSLAAAAGLAFAVSLGEFGATVFLARADAPTLPVAIYRFLGRAGAENVGTAAALSVVLMALVVAVSLVSERSLGRVGR